MSSYFKYFPLLKYRFGDETTTAVFNNLSAYADIVDQARDATSFYTYYTIMDDERPDTLSYRLYGTIDFYWTFYMMNDHVRKNGWPVTNMYVYQLAQQYYPHRTLVTKDNIDATFLVGTKITGSSSGAVGTIVERNIDLGQIVVDNLDFIGGEQIRYFDPEIDAFQVVTVYQSQLQYLSTHHYELDGVWTDIDPSTYDVGTLVPITQLERLQQQNEQQKTIKVLRKEVVGKVVGEFIQLMKGR